MTTLPGVRRAAAFVALALLFAGCGGNSSRSAASGAALPQLRRHDSSTQASLSFAVEQPNSERRATTSSTGFAPSSTGFVVVRVAGAVVLATNATQGQTSFSATFAVPAGNDSFEVDLENVQNQVLSRGTVVQNMPSGATTPLVVALHGVIAAAQLAIDVPFVVGRAQSATLTFVAVDVSGDTIDAGTYASPVKISTIGSSPRLRFSSSAFPSPASVVKISYDGRLMTTPIYVRVVDPPKPAVAQLFILANAYESFTTKGFVNDIATGPKGTLWYTECFEHGCDLGYVDAAGTTKHFGTVPYALNLIEGPDGNMWFTEGENEPGEKGPTIGRITPSGKITEFLIRKKQPHLDFGTFALLVPRDRSGIWFTESGDVGEITTKGRAKEYRMNESRFGPVRAKWFVEGRSGQFYFDGSGVFAFDSTKKTFVQYADLRGPIAWTTQGLFARGNGQELRGEQLLGPDGQIKGLTGTALVLLGESDGSLFGAAVEPGPTPLAGVSVQSLQGATMKGPIYPAAAATNGFFGKIVGSGSTYWGISGSGTSTITRFTYKP